MSKEDVDRGRYVEGDYGKAGPRRATRPGIRTGRYVEGDYGPAGSEGAERRRGARDSSLKPTTARPEKFRAVPQRIPRAATFKATTGKKRKLKD